MFYPDIHLSVFWQNDHGAVCDQQELLRLWWQSESGSCYVRIMVSVGAALWRFVFSEWLFECLT